MIYSQDVRQFGISVSHLGNLRCRYLWKWFNRFLSQSIYISICNDGNVDDNGVDDGADGNSFEGNGSDVDDDVVVLGSP